MLRFRNKLTDKLTTALHQ